MKIQFDVGDDVKYPIKLLDVQEKRKITTISGRKDRWLIWGKVIAVSKGPITDTIYFESKEGQLVKDYSDNFFPAWQNSESIDSHWRQC